MMKKSYEKGFGVLAGWYDCLKIKRISREEERE
jgi:hypothetical protein